MKSKYEFVDTWQLNKTHTENACLHVYSLNADDDGGDDEMTEPNV